MLPLRILSDIHYGDKASRVRSLGRLSPLFEGVRAAVLNGDTMDTRPGAAQGVTEASRQEVEGFFRSTGVPCTFLTGNHDPDISTHHSLELAGGKVFLTHGDVLFDDGVPWSQDREMMGREIARGLAALPQGVALSLEDQLRVHRDVAARVYQRHQTEKRVVQYFLRLAEDTIWPPSRVLKILEAWRQSPGKAAALGRAHRPGARFVLIGHTHRPGIWQSPEGPTVINTGSYTLPLGAYAVDLLEDSLRVIKVDFRSGSFRPGALVREFSLA